MFCWQECLVTQALNISSLRQAKNKLDIALHKSEDNGVNLHWLNFINAIRNNTPGSLHCPIEEGAHIATIAQMGNIAYRSGQKVNWDESKNLFNYFHKYVRQISVQQRDRACR